MRLSRDILIIGGSGYIGQRVSRSLGGRALCTFKSQAIEGGFAFDSSTDRLENVVDLGGVRQALLMLGVSNTIACARDPVQAKHINIDSIERVLSVLKQARIKPIFMSSDAVFDGRKGNYVESDEPSPLMLYGQQKLVIERLIVAEFDEYLILRPGKVYDCSSPGSLLDRWYEAVLSRKEVALATDQIFCPVHVDDLARAIVKAIESDLSGLFHAAGPQAVTNHDLFFMLVRALGLKPEEIKVRLAKINDFAVNEPRPVNCSMVSDRFYQLTGIERVTPEGVCCRFAASRAGCR